MDFIHDKVVETLKSKWILSTSYWLDTSTLWVDFVVTSRAKNLTLDLIPKRVWQCKYIYEFPFQLLDRESMSHLQHLHLNFVYLDLPSWFKGFPNLRKLHLQRVHVNRKDLENMLSHGYTLECPIAHTRRERVRTDFVHLYHISSLLHVLLRVLGAPCTHTTIRRRYRMLARFVFASIRFNPDYYHDR
jgi:hypothetical protein